MRTGYAIQLVGGIVISAVSKQEVDIGNDILAESHAGSAHARLVAKKSSKPKITLTTKDVFRALNAIGAEGKAFGSALTITAVKVFQVALDVHGIPLSSGHRAITFSKGGIFCKQLQCKAGDDATLDIEVHGLSTDGVTSPVAVGSGSLPTYPAPEAFTIGPLELGGDAVNELSSVTIDFGIKPEAVLLDSAVAPLQLSVDSILPTLDFESNKVDAYVDTIPEAGLLCTHADSFIWFRKRKSGGDAGFFGDDEEEHAKMTFDGLAVADMPFTADGNKIGSIKAKVHCQHDGTNIPLGVTIDAAIAP